MEAPLVRQAPRLLLLAAVAGALALLPAVVLVGFGLAGLAVPRVAANPWLVLGGVALALIANVGATVRGRVECCEDGVSLECDLRLRYRGANLLVVIVAGMLAGGIILYLLAAYFRPR